MRIDVLTAFPELFSATAPALLGVSIPARAVAANRLRVRAHNLRDYTINKHGKIDDRPFGGGPGMVLACQPVFDAAHAVEQLDLHPATLIMPTPQGTPLTQPMVRHLAARPRLMILCGHYEGIDERVVDELQPLEISLGDFVLSGGELAALVIIDAIARVLPGVLGHNDSATQDSFEGNDGLLDTPHYTRPHVWKGRAVPDVLLSGNHAAINAWRDDQRRERTKARRPDLLG